MCSIVLPPGRFNQFLIDNNNRNEMKQSTDFEYKQLTGRTISLLNDPDMKKTEALIEKGVFRDGTYAFAATTEHIVEYYQHLGKVSIDLLKH